MNQLILIYILIGLAFSIRTYYVIFCDDSEFSFDLIDFLICSAAATFWPFFVVLKIYKKSRF